MAQLIEKDTKNRLKESIRLPLMIIAAIWLIHIFQVGFEYFFFDLRAGFYFGVYPRNFSGIIGIFTSPFIHGDFSHLFNNSIPFFVLATMTIYFYKTVAFRSIGMIYFLTGLAVWLLARETHHIGLSGVVFGLFGFVLGNGIFRRNIRSIALAFIVFLLYSGMFMGLFPAERGISWESHLSGFLIGLFTAYYFKEELEAEEIRQSPWENEPAIADRPYFLPRDIFEKTRIERRREAEERMRRRDENDGWTSDTTF